MSMTPEEKRARKLEYDRLRYQANKEKIAKQNRKWHQANKERELERYRRRGRRLSFAKEDGSSFHAWLSGLYNRGSVFISIANLQPDPGQTLAELIHELSGYAMEVCEQIANPPIIEDSPALTPPPAEDLF